MTTYNSLEDITSDFISAAQDETAALFKQGDVLVQAVDDGFSLSELIPHCASLIRRKSRTVRYRYTVSLTFPEDKRNPELDWSFHQLCASTDDPYAWLELAARGWTDEDGEHHDHSYDTLKAAIRASGGDPGKGDPVYLLDHVEAVVLDMDTDQLGTWVSFRVPKLPDDLAPGMLVVVSVVHVPAIESAA